ncbi:MAG TPA: hypothetical protein ENK26_03690 [Gammaproteobacteria bacterium]|nr:hypothetical protein [Gammaproteobacteria bacterium]
MQYETLILWLALIAYVLAGTLAIVGAVMGRRPARAVLLFLVVGLMLHTLSLGMRWQRIGHGPYVTMFEILSSNIWSLTLIFTLAYWRIRAIRPAAAVVMPLIFMMMAWMLLMHPGEGHLPSTYDTIWLYIHILMGKVFFGSVLVALALALVILIRRVAGSGRFARMPNDRSLDELAYRFMALGFIFDSLMLVAGAIWAQDAWGRYWSWDPLETWAFLTWLMLGFAIHFRLTMEPSPRVSAVLVAMVFTLGFLTFFGIPFISMAPHKGMV